MINTQDVMAGTEVTTLTANATHDDLTGQDYAEMYTELRANRSLDNLVELLQSAFSKAAWSKWERGEGKLNRVMKNELRLAVGLRPLPPTVAEAMAVADPDATVYQIGHDTPRRVVLIGVNGPVTVRCDSTSVVAAHADRLTSVPRNRAYKGYKALSAPAGIVDRLNALRLSSGLSWGELLSRLLDAEQPATQRATVP